MGNLQKTTDLLLQHGFTREQIFTYPNIYRIGTVTLALRLSTYKELGKTIEIDDIIRSQNFHFEKLQNYMERKQVLDMYPDHVILLKDMLNISDDEARTIYSNRYIKMSKLGTLMKKIELLLEHVTGSDIKDQPLVLRTPLNTLQSRLNKITERRLDMSMMAKYSFLLYCDESKFESYLEDYLQEAEILKNYHFSKEELLKSRLNCDDICLQKMIKSNWSLLSINTIKLNSILDFLLVDLHQNSATIISYPRVFSFALETLEKRNTQLLELGFKNVTVKELALDSRTYKRLVKALNLKM